MRFCLLTQGRELERRDKSKLFHYSSNQYAKTMSLNQASMITHRMATRLQRKSFSSSHIRDANFHVSFVEKRKQRNYREGEKNKDSCEEQTKGQPMRQELEKKSMGITRLTNDPMIKQLSHKMRKNNRSKGVNDRVSHQTEIFQLDQFLQRWWMCQKWDDFFAFEMRFKRTLVLLLLRGAKRN